MVIALNGLFKASPALIPIPALKVKGRRAGKWDGRDSYN